MQVQPLVEFPALPNWSFAPRPELLPPSPAPLWSAVDITGWEAMPKVPALAWGPEDTVSASALHPEVCPLGPVIPWAGPWGRVYGDPMPDFF